MLSTLVGVTKKYICILCLKGLNKTLALTMFLQLWPCATPLDGTCIYCTVYRRGQVCRAVTIASSQASPSAHHPYSLHCLHWLTGTEMLEDKWENAWIPPWPRTVKRQQSSVIMSVLLSGRKEGVVSASACVLAGVRVERRAVPPPQ